MSKEAEEFNKIYCIREHGYYDKKTMLWREKIDFAIAYADKVKLEHTIEALGNVKTDWFHTSDIYDAIDLEIEKHQKQLEQLKNEQREN